MLKNVLFFFGLILFLYFMSSPNWGTTNHTSYTMMCNDYGVSMADCETGFSLLKSTYKAIPETQTIITKNLLLSYDDCNVFDAENWRCGDIVMTDGRYLDMNPADRDNHRTITRIEYTVRSIINFFRSVL